MSDDVTRLLGAIENGDAGAADRLLPLVYDELRRLAAAKLANDPAGQTLQATALVHEAWLRLGRPANDGAPPQRFDGRGHFFAAAAESMRRILVDRARAKNAGKRGGGRKNVELSTEHLFADAGAGDLLDLDDALQRLAQVDASKARLVTLLFFGGLTFAEAAAVLGTSKSSAERLWTAARAWLYRELSR